MPFIAGAQPVQQPQPAQQPYQERQMGAQQPQYQPPAPPQGGQYGRMPMGGGFGWGRRQMGPRGPMDIGQQGPSMQGIQNPWARTYSPMAGQGPLDLGRPQYQPPANQGGGWMEAHVQQRAPQNYQQPNGGIMTTMPQQSGGYGSPLGMGSPYYY